MTSFPWCIERGYLVHWQRILSLARSTDNSPLTTGGNCPVKLSAPWFSILGKFLTTKSILTNLGWFKLSISSWVSFAGWSLLRNFPPIWTCSALQLKLNLTNVAMLFSFSFSAKFFLILISFWPMSI